ncbi:GRP family sugar transporter [Streptomyces sparsogenes]|uniref:GRP family sugar transporter n=1 Tax=Streptomyces sparsogenes TaxID=67365 RepID=UPI0034041B0C
MAALLALASALCYGLVDFFGGILSRRAHFTVVTFLGQIGGLLLALVAALVVPAEAVRPADALWGALSGVGSGTAMHFLNRGLTRGAMSVVIPLSAVTGVALSVLCGVFFLGDRPTVLAWLGIGVTVPALWLVSGGAALGRGEPGSRTVRASADGLIASLGVAVQYIGLAQADPASGVWPVAAGRLAAVAALLPSALRHAPRFRRQPAKLRVQSLATGAGAALGLILYLEAAHRQLLAIAVVLASLYPAVPTVLGLTALREKVTRKQAVGLVSAAVAIVALTLG